MALSSAYEFSFDLGSNKKVDEMSSCVFNEWERACKFTFMFDLAAEEDLSTQKCWFELLHIYLPDIYYTEQGLLASLQ